MAQSEEMRSGNGAKVRDSCNSWFIIIFRRRSGLMVSAVDSGSSGAGSIPGRGQLCSWGKTLKSHRSHKTPPRCINE